MNGVDWVSLTTKAPDHTLSPKNWAKSVFVLKKLRLLVITNNMSSVTQTLTVQVVLLLSARCLVLKIP